MPAFARQGRNGADRHDPAGARPGHLAHQRLGEAGQGEEIDLHRRLGPLLVEHGRQRVAGLAGVVDKAVIAGRLRGLAEAVERALVGEVKGMGRARRGRDARRALLKQRLRGLGRGAEGEVDLVTGAGQRADDRRPDPGRAAP